MTNSVWDSYTILRVSFVGSATCLVTIDMLGGDVLMEFYTVVGVDILELAVTRLSDLSHVRESNNCGELESLRCRLDLADC